LNWLTTQGAAGVGQSSWGPTGFVITASAAAAHDLLTAAKAARRADDPVRFRSVSGRNVGARINEFDNAEDTLLLAS